MMVTQGTIIKSIGSSYDVLLESGKIVQAVPKGNFRIKNLQVTNPLAVGDEVRVEYEENAFQHFVVEILTRKNYLIRQSPRKKGDTHILASNLDQVVLLASISLPRTSLGFIDRVLLNTALYEIPTVIVFNKTDIQVGKNLTKQKEAVGLYQRLGYMVLEVSAATGLNTEVFKEQFKDKRSLVIGHSGVGKSTLVNILIPYLDQKTNEISKKFKKGKHTTSYSELFLIPEGGEVIDCPGVKEFGVADLDKSEVGQGFVEFLNYQGQCKYDNCIHMAETDCAIQDALENGRINSSRYESYVNVLAEIEEKKPY